MIKYTGIEADMQIAVSIKKIETIEAILNFPITNIIIDDNNFSSSTNGLTRREIKKAINIAHKNKINVIVRIDRLFSETEINKVISFLKYLDIIRVDGILFSDVSLKHLVDLYSYNLQTIYAPETLLTNRYDIKQLKNNGFDSCVISKDIPIENSYDIVNEIKDFCYIRIHGPILMSYSARRFISSYLNQEKEYLVGYYLQEEKRNLKMPLVEKKTGTWFYHSCIESLKEINNIIKKPFKGIIIDNNLYDDEYTIKVLRLYQKQLQDNNYQENKQLLQNINQDITYTSVQDIRLTQLEKD